MFKIILPQRLVELVGAEQRDFSVSGDTVAAGIRSLCAAQPALAVYLVNAAGRLKDDIHAFVGDDSAEEHSPVAAGQDVTLLIAQSGGASEGPLTPQEIRRYARHLTLPGVGRSGQQRLKQARVLVIGAGGLGSPLLLYLAALGVGHITLVEFDTVDSSNLQRQIIHDSHWIGKSKGESAKAHMLALNPDIEIELVEARLDEEIAERLVPLHDLVADGTDNFATRDIVNRATRRHRTPLVFGAVYQFEGQVSVFNATDDAPCYRCLFRALPTGDLAPNCAAGGVLGVVPGITGLQQANEVAKLLLGIGEPLIGRLLTIDCLGGTSRTLSFSRAPNCPVCGTKNEAIPTPVASEVPQVSVETIAPKGLAAALALGAPPLVVDVREPGELEIARFDGAVHIPLARIEREGDVLPRDRSLVLLCRSGIRSERAARIMLAKGFTDVRSLEGGLIAWAEHVDPEMVVA